MDASLSLSSAKRWKLKTLVLAHLLIALLLSTFFWSFTQEYWAKLDTTFFKWVNGSLQGRPAWQIFWAFANHRAADWLEDVCILVFFIAHIRRAPKEEKKKRLAEICFCVLYIALILFFVNRVFFREYLQIHRDSPTLVIDSSIHLSREIPWLSIKDDSSKSFPADHATTAILFAVIYSFFASRRLSILACLYAIFLCMPRLVTGAHWLSDILVGSGCIILFFLGWTLCSPFYLWSLDRLEKSFHFFRNFKKYTQLTGG